MTESKTCKVSLYMLKSYVVRLSGELLWTEGTEEFKVLMTISLD